MEIDEKDIAKQLAALKAQEIKAYKRATLYTLIPVLVGLIVLGISAWGAVRLERHKTDAIKQAEEARKETEQLERSTDNARAHLAETQKALAEAKAALNMAEEKLMGVKGNEKVVSDLNQTLKAIDTVGSGRWVVISGDNKLDKAKLAAERARSLGYTD